MGSFSKGAFSKPKSKLYPRRDGPFQVLEKVNDNAYKADLRGKYHVSATFNVFDLSLFDVGNFDSRTNPFKEGEKDNMLNSEEENETHAGNSWENIQSQTNQEAIIMTQGSMTKARAKRLQDRLNACLQARFSVFNKELKLQELLGHSRLIVNLEIKIHSHL